MVKQSKYKTHKFTIEITVNDTWPHAEIKKVLYRSCMAGFYPDAPTHSALVAARGPAVKIKDIRKRASRSRRHGKD